MMVASLLRNPTKAQFRFVFYVVVLLGCGVALGGSSSKHKTTTTTTNFIDCLDPCQGGDVNYELTASVRTMELLNYTYRGRTFSKEGSNSIRGPTMRVQPGQSLWIKLRNELDKADFLGSSDSVTVDDYWNMVQSPGESINYQYQQNHPVGDASRMTVDTANMPGKFDSTNLHLHGLEVDVHLFDPIGTRDPQAPEIVVAPGHCYCYQFHIPDYHPPGLYWYHPHLHGATAATAIQLWSGMFGLLYVEGPLEDELAAYGVVHREELVLWDPALEEVNQPTHTLQVDEFLRGQTGLSRIHPILVNELLNPTLTTTVGTGQVLHLRIVCSTVETQVSIRVYTQDRPEEGEAAIPFWIIASDGVTYQRPIRNQRLVLAGGQREEVLIQFDEPGEYVVSHQGLQGMQFLDMYGNPHDQILATIVVTENPDQDGFPLIPIEEMTFTPGYKEEDNIQARDVVRSESIVFSMGADRDRAPFPQYYVNGKAFDPDRLDFLAQPGEAVEYILFNANHNVHSFHIHANRVQIKEMGTELSIERYPILDTLLDFDDRVWRDTVVVPPNGRTRIWVQYPDTTIGKTVFHCHSFTHEDTGMMATLFIGEPDYSNSIIDIGEHLELFIGLGVGFIVAGVLFFFVRYLCVPGRRDLKEYELVAINEEGGEKEVDG